MSESMKQETVTASTNPVDQEELLEALKQASKENLIPLKDETMIPTVRTSYDPGLTTLEDVEPEVWNWNAILVGAAIALIVSAYFLGSLITANKYLKIQIEQMQRGLR
jgi:hypothetical protein